MKPKKDHENDVVFVVGDVHGMADMLLELHNGIAEYAASVGARRPKIVYVGDYIDRGPDSKMVVELVMAGLDGFDSVPLMGNHESMFVDFFTNPKESNFYHWISNGGMETCLSYGVDPTLREFDGPSVLRDALAQAMPKSHLEFFQKTLKICHDDKFGIYVHAGLAPDQPFKNQSEHDMLWIRHKFLSSERNWGRPVIHGHTIARNGPEDLPNRVNVDTGAFNYGRLTSVFLDGETRKFISVKKYMFHNELSMPPGIVAKP